MISAVEGLPTAPNNFFRNIDIALGIYPGFFQPQTRFCLSLSGGMDSVLGFFYLLHLQRIQPLWKLKCVHFNHHQRGLESDGDAEFCQRLCSQYKIPYQCYSLSFDSMRGNFQQNARKLRYEKLKQEQDEDTWIVTAHHQDDHLENVLLGVHQGRLDSRLLPLRPFNPEKRLFRPFVSIPHAELVSKAHEMELQWREDSSNESLKYLRNWYRHSTYHNYRKQILGFSESLGHVNDSRENAIAELMRKSIQQAPHGLLLIKAPITASGASVALRFFYRVIQKYYPEFMTKLQMKRITEMLNEPRAGKRRYPVAVMGDAQLIITEKTRTYVIESTHSK